MTSSAAEDGPGRATTDEGRSAREEQWTRQGLALLRVEARRLWHRLGRRMELEELEALGHPPLVELVRAYDPRRGRFEPYAVRRLRWGLLDGVRRQTHGRTAAARARALGASDRVGEAQRAAPAVIEAEQPPSRARDSLSGWLRQHAGALAVGLVAVAGDMTRAADPTDDPEQIATRRAAALALRTAVRELPGPQRQIVERHYFADERFDHIAADLGLSKSWASRLHSQAIRALAERLREGSESPCP